MENRDLAEECRKQRRLERLGTQHPICATCGETDWRCLEIHHIVDCDGKSATVILCANCHRKVTDSQKNHPPHSAAADPFLESVGRFLLGIAELLKLAVAQLIVFGEALIKRAFPEGA
jgi:hypothetical protein